MTTLRRHAPAVGALAFVAVAFLAIYLTRREQGFTNVDDFLYARQTGAFLDSVTSGDRGIVSTWREYGVNSPLVPTLAVPLAAVRRLPSTLVIVQLPLLLLLTGSVAALSHHLGQNRIQRWTIAAFVAALPPVLGYAGMLHFAVAAAACTTGALAAYLASERLRRRGPSAAFGALLGLLVLSRVVALVYAAGLGIVVAVDLLMDRKDLRLRALNALLGAGLGLAIAAPWWLTAGPTAWRYLRTAGYGDSMFTTQASLVTRETVRLRLVTDESGLAVTLLLVVGVLLAGFLLRDRLQAVRRPVLLTLASALVTLLLLGTSSNAGTAFGLPVVVLLAAVAAAGLRQLRWIGYASAAVAVACSVALIVATTPPSFDRHPWWLSGTPGRAQADAAMGCRCNPADLDGLNAALVTATQHERVLILRADALVNPESLRFTAERRDTTIGLLGPSGPLGPDTLQKARFVIAGTTPAPYLAGDLGAADQILLGLGFRVVLVRQLSPANRVTLYAAP